MTASVQPHERNSRKRIKQWSLLLFTLLLLIYGILSISSNWITLQQMGVFRFSTNNRNKQQKANMISCKNSSKRSMMVKNTNGHNNSISIAEQSIKLREKPISWVPVQEKDREPYFGKCNHPYHHCCIGQCRQIYYKNDPADEALFVEPKTASAPLANLSMLLEYLEERISKHHNHHTTTEEFSLAKDTKINNSKKCNIWFVGNSLESDTLVAAMCQLTQLGYYEVTGCRNRFGKPNVYTEAQFDSICNKNNELNNNSFIPKNAMGYFELQRTINNYGNNTSSPSSVCETVTLAFYSIAFELKENRTEYDPRTVQNVMKDLEAAQSYNSNNPNWSSVGGVIVWGWGAHCNERGCVKDYLKVVFSPFIRQFLNVINGNTTNDNDVPQNISNAENEDHSNHSSTHRITQQQQQQQLQQPSFVFTRKEQQLQQIPSSSLSSLWSIVWREHEPQHFNSKGGIFTTINGTKETFRCRYLHTLNNFRNVELWNFFNISGLLNIIPIVPIFNSHQPLWNQHYKLKRNKTEQEQQIGPGDCTHYCYSPWRFNVAWNGIYHGLKALDGVVVDDDDNDEKYDDASCSE